MRRFFSRRLLPGFLFALLLLILSGPRTARATHAMGADLQYTCQGGNTYEVKLTVYRDCAGILLPNTRPIHFKSDSCGVSEYIINATRQSITELTPICPSQQPMSSCQGGPLPGVEQHVYTLTTTLQSQCPDWKIFWFVCCRNYSITNSAIGTNNRMYIEATLDNLNVSCNSSPYFTVPPVPFLCDGEPFSFNNGAIDPDGDSLVFELVNPLDWNSTTLQPFPVPYNTGFTQQLPVSTSPPNSFSFDQYSGQFSFTPSGIQQGIVALLVKEYRNGLLIGTTMRDIQIVVINCTNSPPVITPPTNVQGGQLNGNTFSICLGNTLSFDIGANDPDPGDTLQLLSTIAQAISAANWSITGINPLTGTFSWTPTAADLGSHFFSLTFQDNGCPLIGQQVVGFNIIVQAGEVLPAQSITICSDSLQTIPLQASTPNPFGLGSYSWSPATGLSNPGIANPVATIQGPASYVVTYLEAGSCPIIEPVEIVSEGTILLSMDSARICLDDSVQLQVSFSQTGSTGPFVYTWDPPFGLNNTTISNPLATPTASTTYTVTVTTLSCDFTEPVYIQVDSVPDLTGISGGELCAGDTIQLFSSGTQLTGVDYHWSPLSGLDNPKVPNPLAFPGKSTNYRLVVTNSCGVDSALAPVVVHPPLNIDFGFANPNCNGAQDGSMQVLVTGGSGTPVQYNWLPNVSSTALASNLGPGAYTVVVNDLTANCSDTATATLVDPPPLLVTITDSADIDCFGDVSGELQASATGGSAPYQYSIDGVTFLDSSRFTFLAAGNYTVTVRDKNGCLTSSNAVLLSQPPTPLSMGITSVTNTNCNTSVGSITAQASGGVGSFLFSIDGINFGTDSVFNGLTPGTYTIYAQDSLGCEANISQAVHVTADPIAVVDTVFPISCYGGSDGLIQVSGSSGLSPYEFSLDGGPFGPATSFPNQSAGIHTLTMRDANGCLYSVFPEVEQPDSLYAYIGTQQDIDCNGNITGHMLIIAQGGTKPYSYSLDGVNFQSSGLFINLAAGPYSVTAQDSNGCSFNFPAQIGQPNVFIVINQDVDDVNCNGEYTGSVTLSASGGVAPYSYSPDGVTFISDSVFGFLAAGSYLFFALDVNGCPAQAPVVINEPTPLVIAPNALDPADCFGVPSGSASAIGSGGTPPYSYALGVPPVYQSGSSFNNLPAGYYFLSIQDSNLCVADTLVEISQPPPLLYNIQTRDIICYADSNGYAEAQVSGGSPPYSYLWTDGSTQFFADQLSVGNIDAIITDANGCEGSVSGEIIEPPELVFDTLSYTDISCFGAKDGTARTLASGGRPPLAYVWSAGGSLDSIAGLDTGRQVITVIDSLGCERDSTFRLSEPEEIVITLVDRDGSFCNLANGFILVDVSGGSPDYDIQWETQPPQIGVMATDLFGGFTYTIRVLDSIGCELRDTFYIAKHSVPTAAFYSDLSPPDSAILPIQGVNFTNTSVNAISYQWSVDGTTFSSGEIDLFYIFQKPGLYTVTLVAYDSINACPDTATLRLTLIPPGAIYVANAFTPNSDGKNDTFFPVGKGVVEMEMVIYDRWGVELTRLNSMAESWNGTHRNGGPVQEGVYVWVLKALINNGRVVKKAGTVTLFR